MIGLGLGARLATNLHRSHSLGDICDTGSTTLRSSGRRVALSRSWVTSVCRLLCCGLLLSIDALTILRVTLSTLLRLLHLLLLLIWLRVATVGRRRRTSELLTSALHLTADAGIGTRANVESPSSITSLLLLARCTCVRLRGALLVILGLVGLCVLAILAISSRF